MPSSLTPDQGNALPEGEERGEESGLAATGHTAIDEDSVSEPVDPGGPRPDWAHRKLFDAVRSALYSLPDYFQTDLMITGIAATDLHTFNTSLGATIESQVVVTLNALRTIWDPENQYAGYRFVRQAQRFPDVILQAADPELEPSILMGIELKGWYVLAKERVPSFRYMVTPAVCAAADLLVVAPWALAQVISGAPRLFRPYIIGARYAAEYRNWHWLHQKAERSSGGIILSTETTHYPNKSAKIADRAESDSGGNFGRLARTKVMDAYITELFREELSGIPLSAWQEFFAIFTEHKTPQEVARSVERIAREYGKRGTAPMPLLADELKARLTAILDLLNGNGE
jgi:hypothetical protein